MNKELQKQRVVNEIITVPENFQIWRLWLEGRGFNHISAHVSRSYNSVKVIPWKTAVNYENKGSRLVAYLSSRPRLDFKRPASKWTVRESEILKAHHDNKEPRHAEPLTLFELSVLLGRTEGAIDKELRAMYPKVNYLFPEL